MLLAGWRIPLRISLFHLWCTHINRKQDYGVRYVNTSLKPYSIYLPHMTCSKQLSAVTKIAANYEVFSMAKAIPSLALVELYSPKDSLFGELVKHTDGELILHNAVTLRYDSSHGNLHLCGVSSDHLPDGIQLSCGPVHTHIPQKNISYWQEISMEDSHPLIKMRENYLKQDREHGVDHPQTHNDG